MCQSTARTSTPGMYWGLLQVGWVIQLGLAYLAVAENDWLPKIIFASTFANLSSAYFGFCHELSKDYKVDIFSSRCLQACGVLMVNMFFPLQLIMTTTFVDGFFAASLVCWCKHGKWPWQIAKEVELLYLPSDAM